MKTEIDTTEIVSEETHITNPKILFETTQVEPATEDSTKDDPTMGDVHPRLG